MDNNNEKYQNVLESNSKRICVIAGPGTGKTKGILLPKVEALLAAGVPPEQILLLSFSRLSALDLKSRVKGKVPASTVHSLGLAFLLSENSHGIRDRVETIVLEFEENTLICDLKIQFPGTRKADLRQMLKKYKAGWATAQQDSVLEEDDEQRRFKAAVMNWLKEHRAALLGEIMYSGVELIKQLGKTGILEKVKYVLVDEYQDLNKLEQEFVARLAESTELLLVVGDPDQSIYSFKFAHPDGIVEFKKTAEAHFLEYCMRCGKAIVDFANQLLVQASPGRTDLPKGSSISGNGSIDMPRPFRTEDEEFAYVLASILDKLSKGAKAEDILVLFPKKPLADKFLRFVEEKGKQDLEKLGAVVKLASKSGFSDAESESVLLFSLAANPASLLHARVYLGLEDANTFAEEFQEGKEKYGDLQKFLDSAKAEDFPARRTRIRRLCTLIQQLNEIRKELAVCQLDELIEKLFPKVDSDLAWINYALRALREENDTVETLHRKCGHHTSNDLRALKRLGCG